MAKELIFTIGDLKTFLSTTDLPDETRVILGRDAEGNEYSPLASVYIGWYVPETRWRGDCYSEDNVVTPEQVDADVSYRDAVEQGDLRCIDPCTDERVIVLGPLV